MSFEKRTFSMIASQERTPVRSLGHGLQIFIFSGNRNIYVTPHGGVLSSVRKLVERKWALSFSRSGGTMWPIPFTCCSRCRNRDDGREAVSAFLPLLVNTDGTPKHVKSSLYLNFLQCRETLTASREWREVRHGVSILAAHSPCPLAWPLFPFTCGHFPGEAVLCLSLSVFFLLF